MYVRRSRYDTARCHYSLRGVNTFFLLHLQEFQENTDFLPATVGECELCYLYFLKIVLHTLSPKLN